MKRIIVVDDDNDMCMLLNRFLSRHGYEVFITRSGKEALEWLKKNTPDLMLCDFRLGDMSGSELLDKIKNSGSSFPMIIITGYSDVKDAVDVMKLGAVDYITKPLFPDEILLTIKNVLSINKVTENIVKSETKNTKADPAQNASKSTKNETFLNGRYIIGNSEGFTNIMKQINLVAPTNYTVIIYGESGTGKEAIAQQIHYMSKRSDKPFVAIDCGTLSKELAGSELFGHEKGSFTGALTQKTGSLERANGGTIFLDEIANLSYDVQVSLLRVVQERKIKPIGSNKDIDIDVRIIVASNQNLWDYARNGKFREDLYHRFNEFCIDVLPLRERKEDIMLFANHFLQLTNDELGKNLKGFSKQVENIFNDYIWYGNLRELKNVVKRATLLSDGEWIEVQSLPFEITNFKKLQFDPPQQKTETKLNDIDITENTHDNASFDNKLKNANINLEYKIIVEALKQVNFNKSKAAVLLNVDRKTLYNKLKQYKILNAAEI